MKIIFLGRYNAGEFLTGPEKVAKRIFLEFIKTGSSVFIEYFFDGRENGIFKKLFGHEIILKNENSAVLRLGLLYTLLYFFKQKPDIIHIITYERFALAAFIYKVFCKVKIVYNIHGVIVHENTQFRKVSRLYYFKDKVCEKVFLKYSDILIFLSEETVNIASSYFDLDKSKIVIFPNGIDEIFHLKSRRNENHESDKLRIVFTGNINREEKGFKFLREFLLQSDINFELYLAGNSGSSGLNNFINVSLMDTPAFADFLSDKQIFISASKYEPFSMSAAEAMAAGLVAVVTKQTGMSRYISDNENGFVFEYGDEIKLNEILNRLFIDREGLNNFQNKSREIYYELNWKKVFDKYKDLYVNISNSK